MLDEARAAGSSVLLLSRVFWGRNLVFCVLWLKDAGVLPPKGTSRASESQIDLRSGWERCKGEFEGEELGCVAAGAGPPWAEVAIVAVFGAELPFLAACACCQLLCSSMQADAMSWCPGHCHVLCLA